jgi:hypothetical protein
MISRNYKIHIVLILSILLFIGQFATLIHSVKHSFHTQDESCQIFLQCEKLGSGVVLSKLPLPPILVIDTLIIIEMVRIWLPFSRFEYYVRAPPSSFL